MTKAQARWRCETCKGELAMPAACAEWGYFCCFASMTPLGVVRAAQGTEAGTAETVKQGSVHDGPVAESDAP
jgi:hypothetical protein